MKTQRPTTQEFTDAAIRFKNNNYLPWWQSSYFTHTLGALAGIFTFNSSPVREPTYRKDLGIIQREQEAEGYVIGEEDINVFAKHQLIRHIKLRAN